MFSYFPYAAAFISDEAGNPSIDTGLLGVALVVAPFVFVVIALVSRNLQAGRMVLWSMGLLLALGLAVGLISPVLGAAAGFGVGAALCLRLPDIPGQMRRRLVGVSFAVVYTMVLLFTITPAGVISGALVPTIMVGFADEYGAWRTSKDRSQQA